MNLEDTIQFITKEILKVEDVRAKKVYLKIRDWLDELLRYRLFMSEYCNEYISTDKEHFTKEEIIKFLNEEIEDWELINEKEDI